MLNVEIIEEDSAMRMLLTEWLEESGYRVGAARSLRCEPARDIDAVVVDLGRTAADMAAIAGRAAALYPGAVLVGASTRLAQTTAGSSRQARALGLSRIVSKPCTRQELLTAITQALAEAP